MGESKPDLRCFQALHLFPRTLQPCEAPLPYFVLPQVAEALLHMQVRLGMLKADDVPSLQAPPAPSVVGGAIMLGTGAVLPQLVPVSIVELL